MPHSGFMLFDPRSEDIRPLMKNGRPVNPTTWKEFEHILRAFARELYEENLRSGFTLDDKSEMSAFRACAILRDKPSEIRWFGFKIIGLPGVNDTNCDKFDISQLEAFFDGRWRLAKPDERRNAMRQQIADAIAAQGRTRSKLQEDFKKAISDAFAKA